MSSFFQHQLAQIKGGGPRIFLRKVSKTFGLVSMGLLAPLAVYLKINWPQAYLFVGNRYLKKYKEFFVRYNGEKELLKEIGKIEDTAISYLEKYIAHQPDLKNIGDWVNANMAVFHMLINRNKYDEGRHQRTAFVVRKIAEKHHLDELGIEFVPRAFALGSIGVYENLAIYIKAGLLGLRPPKKLFLLLDPKAKINNPCYLKYWSQYVTVISDPCLIEAIALLEEVLTAPLAFYMSFNKKTLSSPFALGWVQKKWNMEERVPILTISDEDYKRGWDSLKALGVAQGAWFVCLHVRESRWNDNEHAGKFRNADIKTYFPAIKAIVDAGGWVIRMGDPSMTPLPQMDHVIDYAHSPMKSDWMDVFLCSRCRFIIGTSSGVYTIAVAFGAPVVMTNLLPVAAMYQLSSNDIFIPRICRSITENRTLSFRELIAPAFGRAFAQHHYDDLAIDTIANTVEEIKDAVIEMLGRFDGTLKYREEDENLQEQFKVLAASYGEAYGDKGITVNARIGQSFLRKYISLLPSDTKDKAFI